MKYLILMLTLILILHVQNSDMILKRIHEAVWGMEHQKEPYQSMWPESPFGLFYLRRPAPNIPKEFRTD